MNRHVPPKAWEPVLVLLGRHGRGQHRRVHQCSCELDRRRSIALRASVVAPGSHPVASSREADHAVVLHPGHLPAVPETKRSGPSTAPWCLAHRRIRREHGVDPRMEGGRVHHARCGHANGRQLGAFSRAPPHSSVEGLSSSPAACVLYRPCLLAVVLEDREHARALESWHRRRRHCSREQLPAGILHKCLGHKDCGRSALPSSSGLDDSVRRRSCRR